jgi:ketosteroid isomerase-like protein
MTIIEHPNALLIRQSWQAVSHSDIETLRELWSDDIVWHVTGNNPFQGDHIGCDAVLDYLAQVGESGESYDTTLKSVMANEDYAALVCHVTSKRDDRILDVDQLLLSRFEDRRIKEVWTISLDPRASDRFWAR